MKKLICLFLFFSLISFVSAVTYSEDLNAEYDLVLSGTVDDYVILKLNGNTIYNENMQCSSANRFSKTVKARCTDTLSLDVYNKCPTNCYANLKLSYNGKTFSKYYDCSGTILGLQDIGEIQNKMLFEFGLCDEPVADCISSANSLTPSASAEGIIVGGQTYSLVDYSGTRYWKYDGEGADSCRWGCKAGYVKSSGVVPRCIPKIISIPDTGCDEGYEEIDGKCVAAETPSEDDSGVNCQDRDGDRFLGKGDYESCKYRCGLNGDEYCHGAFDCNDFDSNINPGVSEVCNGIDDNCMGHCEGGSGLQKCVCLNGQDNCIVNDCPENFDGKRRCNMVDEGIKSLKGNSIVPGWGMSMKNCWKENVCIPVKNLACVLPNKEDAKEAVYKSWKGITLFASGLDGWTIDQSAALQEATNQKGRTIEGYYQNGMSHEEIVTFATEMQSVGDWASYPVGESTKVHLFTIDQNKYVSGNPDCEGSPAVTVGLKYKF